ncbi:hypothetical protein DAMA08_047260 [Martiniozyma asiatica (nom. inval.)]|nr:hypothetical protein DAMA08_047260 [Martiniozyma asiatica]
MSEPTQTAMETTAEPAPVIISDVMETDVLQEQQEKEEEEEQKLPYIPTKLHLSGVDDLSVVQLKTYIDEHIKPSYSFNNRDQYSYLSYHLDWINDHEVNLVFDNKDKSLAVKGAQVAIEYLKKRSGNIDETIYDDNLNPLDDRECWDLVINDSGKIEKSNIAYLYSLAKKLVTDDHTPPVECNNDPIHLFVRFATVNDKKEHLAREKSRYYLIHGEPERVYGGRTRTKANFPSINAGRDVITGEEPELNGVFGYEKDYKVNVKSNRKWQEVPHDQKWRNDEFFNNISRETSGRNYRDRERNNRRRRKRDRDGDGENRHARQNKDARNDGRGGREDEGDLFPDFFANRERSPLRD